jgi:hypothetical protein
MLELEVSGLRLVCYGVELKQERNGRLHGVEKFDCII